MRTQTRLEVNGMHVLQRPHLPRAITVTVIAAMLAIVLTLAMASTLRDNGLAPVSARSATAAGQPAATAQAPSTSPFTRSPFTNLLSAPVPRPWAQNRP
jgi:hypothetical protein